MAWGRRRCAIGAGSTLLSRSERASTATFLPLMRRRWFSCPEAALEGCAKVCPRDFHHEGAEGVRRVAAVGGGSWTSRTWLPWEWAVVLAAERREHPYVRDTPPPGIGVDEWDAERLAQSYFPKRPPVTGGEGVRIGLLLPGGEGGDRWWVVTPENTDAFSDCLDSVIQYGIAWLLAEAEAKRTVARCRHSPLR